MKKRWLSTVALVLALTMILVACGGGSKETPKDGKKDGTKVETKGKTLNLVFDKQGTGKNFDYVWWNRGAIYQILTYRGLFKANPEMTEFSPDLAEKFEVSADKLTYTFTMKDGLKWSDGQPLTAKDVAFSISSALKVAQINGIYSAAFTKIEGAKDYQKGGATELKGLKVDGNKVIVKLEKPVGNLVAILSQFGILPEHSLKGEDMLKLNTSKFWEKPVTNGMFKVDEVVTDSHILLSVNENYEGPKPKIEKIRVTMVSQLLPAAESGQADFFNTKVPTEIKAMTGKDGWKNYPVDTLFYFYLIMNLEGVDGNKNEAFQNPKVREALLYAIDREGLAKSLYPELGTVINAGVPERDSKNYNPEIKKYNYDPEKAKQLLKEANFDFNKTLQFRYYMGDKSAVDLYNAMAQNLAQVGVKVNVQKVAGDATTEIFKLRKFDYALKGLAAFGYEEWYGEYASSSATFPNIIGNKGQAFDALYDQLLQESDPGKRAEILKKLQVVEQENLLKLPLFTLKNMIFVNTKKLTVPEGIKFGNPWYAYDLQFDKWELK